MNIIKRELRSNVKSMIIWSVSIMLLIVLWMVEFESFASNPQMEDFMSSLPSGMLDAFGMGRVDLSSLGGFISVISLYLYLIFGIHGALLGSSIISKEEGEKTAEYLFTRPISREKVLASKTISAIINLVFLNLVSLLAMILSSMAYDKDEVFYRFLGLLFLSIFLIQMIFLSVGMLVGSWSKSPKKTGNISVSIVIISFIIATLINIVDQLDFLKYITPFRFFDGEILLKQGSIEGIFIVISLVIIILSIGGTFILYPRRDLHI